MWKRPGLQECWACTEDPTLWVELGRCGGLAVHPLLVMVGEPVDRCPTWMASQSERVMEAADLVPGPHGPGALDGVPAMTLPHYHRDLLAQAAGWLAAWEARRGH